MTNTILKGGSTLPLAPSEADFQKITDAADFHHPLLQRILQVELGNRGPLVSQRLWEFAIAYAALESLGFLQKDNVALSFGSGVEVLLYAISNKIKLLYATDLYTSDSVWSEAKADDARKFIIERATIPFNPDAIKVLNMDMRKACLPDASVDFCYSISAMEHIGNDADYITHLREARRILKDDGVYLLTTTFIPAAETIPQPGTYLFSLTHLQRLFEQAGFHPCERFNAEISDSWENTPLFNRALKTSPFYDNFLLPGVFKLYMSEPYGACCFLLRKRRDHSHGMKITGLDKTRGQLNRLRLIYQKQIWSQPVAIVTDYYRHVFAQNPSFFCFSQLFEFGDDEIQVTYQFVCEQELDSEFLLYVQHCPVTEPPNVGQSDHQHFHLRAKPGDVCHHVFTIKTKARVGYAFIARVQKGQKPEETHLWLRRKNLP